MSTLASLIVKLGLEASDYFKGLSEAEKKTKPTTTSIGNSLLSIGAKLATAGIAAGVGAITGAVVKGVLSVQDWAGTLDSIGDVLGTTSLESAGLAVAIKGVGGDVDALTGQMAFMTRGLVDAEGKLGPTGKTLESLGVTFQDANGKMLPATDILTSVADKLAAMPDGLEKTRLMTELFGKSGKDLTDVMSSLANGGLAAAEEKAQRLGLALGDDLVGSSIELSKQWENVKMIGQGLFVTLGSQLLPIILPLITQFSNWGMSVMPMVSAGLSDLVTWATNAANAFLAWLPTLQPVVDFLVANWQPIVLGIVAFILGFIIPAFVAWASAAIASAVATITALAPVVLPILAIAAVVALLAAAWKNDWGGIRTALTNIWNANLKPIFEQLKAWLGVKIPEVIATLKQFWETKLHPALEKVWAFIQNNVIPIFKALVAFWVSGVKIELNALSVLWNTVLWPALNKVWAFISASVLPIFKSLVNFWITGVKVELNTLSKLWSETLHPALKKVSDFITGTIIPAFTSVVDYIKGDLGTKMLWLKEHVIDPVKQGFANIAGAIQDIITKIADFIEWIKKAAANIPSIFQPGSPTPFEVGLRGIGQALANLSDTELPAFTARLQLQPEGLAAITGAGGGQQTTNNYYLQGQYKYESEESQIDQLKMLQRLKG